MGDKVAGVYVLGTDENGMGPRLGPLVATGVCLKVARYRPGHQHEVGRLLGVDDSKATVAFGKAARAESLALALVECELGRPPEDADTFLSALSLDSLGELQRPCPEASRAQCWTPLSLPHFGGSLEEGRRILAVLGRRGIVVHRVRTTLACVARLNAELRRGHPRTDVDLAQFERLVLDARDSADAPIRAICGMVGGIRKYRERFQHFAPREIRLVHERRHRCCYDVADVGRVAFEVDADAHHLPVALASMVGKFVRELVMARHNTFYAGHDPALPEVSGYHDPVTARFVQASVPLRRRLGIVADCFERDKAGSARPAKKPATARALGAASTLAH